MFQTKSFKFVENGRKFFKQAENTVGKEEIAHYEQCLLFPYVFKRLVLQLRKNQGLFGKNITPHLCLLTCPSKTIKIP